MSNKLTDKQKRFCDEYLVDSNAKQAAIRAGYSKNAAKEQGSRLLTYANVQQYISSKQEKVTQKLEISQERVLNEYAKGAFSDIRRIYDEDGNVLPVKDWPDDIAAAVASIEVDEVFTTGKKRKLVGYTKKVKFWSKTSFLNDLAKHLGLFEKDNEQKRPEALDLNGLNAADKLQLLKLLAKAGSK